MKVDLRELIALLNLSSWCLVMVERLFLVVPRGCMQFVIVVFPDHTHLLYFGNNKKASINTLVVSHNDSISFSYFTSVKHTRNFM